MVAGCWVGEYRGQSFFRLFARALHLERRESADLLKSLVQPAGAEQLIRVFEAMAAVMSLFPGSEAKAMRGGTVYSVGRFVSPRYADVVCDKYISLGLFTARVEA